MMSAKNVHRQAFYRWHWYRNYYARHKIDALRNWSREYESLTNLITSFSSSGKYCHTLFLRIVFGHIFEFLQSFLKGELLSGHVMKNLSGIVGGSCLQVIDPTELVPHFNKESTATSSVMAKFADFPVPRYHIMIRWPVGLRYEEHAYAVPW